MLKWIGDGAYLDGYKSFFELCGASGYEDDVGALSGKLFGDGESHAFGGACDENRLGRLAGWLVWKGRSTCLALDGHLVSGKESHRQSGRNENCESSWYQYPRGAESCDVVHEVIGEVRFSFAIALYLVQDYVLIEF